MCIRDRYKKEAKCFAPPDLDPNRKPGRTQRDAFQVPPHGAKPDPQWLTERRNEIWKTGAFAKRSASNKLTTIHNSIIKNDPRLADPTKSVTAEQRSEATTQWEADHPVLNETFGRPKCEEVAFSERMQAFSGITRA
eukprot:TRINITY_DN1567_c0_g1_i2.p1 TRINITY_DN1567_c0_g1~~TRINITY_DN1567_c0_g1_i2.p1  ORF type:complete len:137 (+),score=28.84 TRINITY_DN1567_c0_g1_i2:79-489(+)